MLELITDWLIKRRLKKEHIDVTGLIKNPKSEAFSRVLNTLSVNKVVVVTKDDGIYIRMAGDESKGEAFSKEFVKVLPIKKPNK
jgi:hypothetical protein